MAAKFTREQVLEMCASRDAGQIAELLLNNADLTGAKLTGAIMPDGTKHE